MENNILKGIYSRIDYLICSGYGFSIADNIGLCVLFANKYKQSGDPNSYSNVKKALDRLININEYTSSDIVTGSSGVLWLLKYIKKLEILDFSTSDIELMEKATVQQFKSSLLVNNWDYHTGAIGHLLALDSSQYYKEFLDYLKLNIINGEDGNYKLLSVKYNQNTNLGVHAGILGVLSVLNNLIQKGYYVRESIEIKDKILQIIFNKLHKTKNKIYPALYNQDNPCRMCWTYGELALAFQLLYTAYTNNDKELEQEVFDIAINTTRRDTLEDTMVIDSCIICGSSGNYLLYKLLDRYFPTKGFEKSIKLWLDYTCKLLIVNNFYNINRYTQERKIDLSILEGLCGICLSFENFDDLWYEYALLGLFNKDKRGTENL